MKEISLLEFIAKAHKHTYAAPKEIKSKYRCDTPILPGHKDYDFIEGNYRYHDSYAGNIWAPGREVISFNNNPIWCMSYQGQTKKGLSEGFIDETFEFLKKALRNFDEKIPFRGLDGFKENDFEYSFKIEGNHRYFIGRESIKYKQEEVFFQNVMGSLIK